MIAKLLSVGEVADLLGVSIYTVYSWVSQGRIPCLKLGTRIMFHPQEIQDWLDEQSRPVAAARPTRLVATP